MEFTIEDIAMCREAFLEYLMSNNLTDEQRPRAQVLFERFGQWKRFNEEMMRQQNANVE